MSSRPGLEREFVVRLGADHLRRQLALQEPARGLRLRHRAVLDQDRAAQHGVAHLASQLSAVPQRVLGAQALVRSNPGRRWCVGANGLLLACAVHDSLAARV
jgi:hypothetical protein